MATRKKSLASRGTMGFESRCVSTFVHYICGDKCNNHSRVVMTARGQRIRTGKYV